MVTLVSRDNTKSSKWRALQLRRVPALAPLDWLARSWRDMQTHLGASLAYGVIVSVFSIALLAYPMHPFVFAGLVTGFMLVAPVLAAGLIALSRLHSKGEKPRFDESLKVLREFRKPLLRLALFLATASALWFALSSILVAQMFGSAAPPVATTIMGNVLGSVSLAQAAVYFCVAGAFAAVVFMLSAVTVPAIIDHKAGVRQAMATSVRAVLRADLPAMALWAGLCLLLVALGFATMMIGMIVIFPLLGHATWYAYLDLVR